MELHRAGCIKKYPKLFLVQSEFCHPLYQAQGTPHDVITQFTYAEGIAIGKPMRGAEIRIAITRGKKRSFSPRKQVFCQPGEKLAREGLFVEHTTAATYAAYQACLATHELEGESLLPLCGAGLKSEK